MITKHITATVAAPTEAEADALVDQLARSCCEIANSAESEGSSVHLADASTADLCVLVIEHKHGTTCALHTSHENAKASVLAWAREWWNREFPDRPMPDGAPACTRRSSSRRID